MMSAHKIFGLAFSALLLSSCTHYAVPPTAYYNRGDPENLMEVNAEIITISLTSQASLKDLAHTIKDDLPTRADLHCSVSDPLCAGAKKTLEQHGVEARYAKGNGSVDLVYERISARDCEHRYINNSINPYNLPPPTFGCSVTSNTVQMVTDKRQFTDPSLTDVPDAQKAVQVYGKYQNPPAEDAGDSGNDSLLQSVSTGQ
jgi:hypothetical protein